MDYGFTDKEVFIIWESLQSRKSFYEQSSNTKENRRCIRETEALIHKIESLDPMFRAWNLAKARYLDT